jgi:GAF domain-containing protein
VLLLAEYGFGGVKFLDYPFSDPNKCPIRLTCSRPLPVIISDLSKDDRFCDIPCVELDPKLKFYTAVAINFVGPTQGAMFIANVKSNSNFLLQDAVFLALRCFYRFFTLSQQLVCHPSVRATY